MTKRLFAWILAISLIFSFSACGRNDDTRESDDMSDSPESASTLPKEDDTQAEDGETSAHGSLKVEGTQLCDNDGNPVQLRGLSTHGLAWFPDYVNPACFQELRDNWGINVIRLAMYTSEYGGYCSGGDQAALKDLVNSGVRYATELGMYVIIDWHILSDSNPNTYKSEALSFFAEMSAQYADYDNVLYEICNEPNGSTSWADVKAYAAEVIPVIRANDPDGIILVGTPNWCQYVDQAAADPITGYDNIMYTLHFYADTHREDLRSRMEAAIQSGLPIFVSEYGICDASGGGAINSEQAALWIEALDRLGVSYVAWNISNKEETSAIFKSSCAKTSGFVDGDLSSSGLWLKEMLTGEHSVSAPAAASKPAASPAPTPSDTKPVFSGGTKGMDWSAELFDSWNSGGETYYHYILTLTNNTGADCSKWTVEIPFQGAITLSDGWNGDYMVSGSTLRITSKDYNGSVPAGGTVNEVGFIIYGNGQLKM